MNIGKEGICPEQNTTPHTSENQNNQQSIEQEQIPSQEPVSTNQNLTFTGGLPNDFPLH